MKELVILGYGAAGFAALIKANELGVKPVLIGYGTVGGTCVNVGCVPSKKMLRIGEIYNYVRKIYNPKYYPDFFKSFKEKQELVDRLRKVKYEDILSKYDVELIKGKAYFTSPNSVKVNGKTIEAKKFIIATGSSPNIPEIKGLKELGFWTNVEALSPDKKIDSLIIIGGRALALEFAQMYNRLGIEVAILQRSKLLIPNWEPEISLEAKKLLEDEGIAVFTDIKIKEIKKGNGKIIVTNRGEIEGDEILLAMGRKPNVELNLDVAKVKLNEKGGIAVDEELRSTNPNIFAAGDVIGSVMLESLAGKQGSIAAENAIANAHKKIDMISVPQVIFTQPNIARVGLTMREAEKIYNIDTRVIKMKDIAKANILDETRGLIKMIIDSNTKKVLGVQMLGENAAEIINEAALAVRLRATIDDIIDTVHVFPTMAESLKLAAIAFYRDITNMSCCVD